MSYFPSDIPFMSEQEREYHGIKIPKVESNVHISEKDADTISRQTAPDALKAQKEAIENCIQHMIGDNSREVARRNQVVFDMDIIQSLSPAQPEQHIDSDGTLWVTVDDVSKVNRVIVDEEKSKFCKTFYQDAQYENKFQLIMREGHKEMEEVKEILKNLISARLGMDGKE